MKEDYRFNHRLQLLDPRWKKKAEEIRIRDYYQCQKCGSFENLNVHHKYYLKDRKLWDYPDDLLIVLCNKCHFYEHQDLKKIGDIINDLKEVLFASEILEHIEFLKLPDRE